MPRHERQGGTSVESLRGGPGPLDLVLDRVRELGTRGFDGHALALGDDVRSAAHVDELRGPVAGHGGAGGEPVADLPAAHHQDPGHGKGREHRRRRARTPVLPAAAEQEPEGDGNDQEKADGTGERGRGEKRPHPQAP